MENLRWGREDATLEEMEAAVALAGASDFIEALPEGYGSLLGRGGVNLSGGQRQRLSLARALIRRPSLLILDDATSAVDAVTEASIIAGLETWRGTTTTLLVTQRISAARMADRVLVLEGGRVAGFGPPDELDRSSPVWRDMLRAQLGAEALDAPC
jgi:ATP-binding cassette subfamily B protein